MNGGDPTPETRRRNKRTLWILLAIALALAFLPLAVWLGFFGAGNEPLRVGFLPFRSPPGDPGLQQAATGLMEATYDRFHEQDDSRFFLIGPSDTRGFQGSSAPPDSLGMRLGADVVLAGAVRSTGPGKTKVSAAVIRVEDGRALWSGELEVPDVGAQNTRSYLSEWIWDRARRTLQTVRPPRSRS